MRKFFKGSIFPFVGLLLAAQFIRPARTNPPVEEGLPPGEGLTLAANTESSPQVAAILERSCGDCHSYSTHWPWYSNVAPVSWFVIDHVNHGRKHLNLSTWSKPSPHRLSKSSDEMLERICKMAASGEMPPSSYVLLHHEAKLSPQDVKAICEWTRSERENHRGNHEEHEEHEK